MRVSNDSQKVRIIDRDCDEHLGLGLGLTLK
jgi:hypothetical protein